MMPIDLTLFSSFLSRVTSRTLSPTRTRLGHLLLGNGLPITYISIQVKGTSITSFRFSRMFPRLVQILISKVRRDNGGYFQRIHLRMNRLMNCRKVNRQVQAIRPMVNRALSMVMRLLNYLLKVPLLRQAFGRISSFFVGN